MPNGCLLCIGHRQSQGPTTNAHKCYNISATVRLMMSHDSYEKNWFLNSNIISALQPPFYVLDEVEARDWHYLWDHDFTPQCTFPSLLVYQMWCPYDVNVHKVCVNSGDDYRISVVSLLFTMNRVRICNLGWHLFPSKVASDTPFLSSLWIDLSEILYTFHLSLGQKSTKMVAKPVHRQLR